VIGGRFGASGAALNRQLAIAALDVNAYYYCELFDSGGAPHFALSYTPDNVSFFELAQSPAQLPFANGDVSLTLRHRPPTFEGVTTWPVTAQTLSQPIPTGITPTRIGIAVQGIDARFDYFLQIHTDP